MEKIVIEAGSSPGEEKITMYSADGYPFEIKNCVEFTVYHDVRQDRPMVTLKLTGPVEFHAEEARVVLNE